MSQFMRKTFVDESHEWAMRHPYGPFREPTFMRHVQFLEDRQADRHTRSQRERTEPLNTLVTKAAAMSIREATMEANAEVPQDDNQARKVCIKSPKSGVGLMITGGASLEQVATWIAKRTLEKWIRILKPFACGPGLAVLISRLVHEDFYRARQTSEGSPGQGEIMQVIPPVDDLLGAAFRKLTPSVEDIVAQPWTFVEDMEAALHLEGEFNNNPDHPLRPNSHPKRPSRTSSSLSRPSSVGALQTMSPKGCSGALRRSGAFPWADFQMDNPNRLTTMTNFTHKQLRKYPGPDTYGDVARIFTAPQRASWGRFPRAGDRRTQCTCTPLSQLSRYFKEEHVIAS